ncbi:MAG: stage III sporulation protein AC [Peptococcaceae bacterium]|jgi:stage III sporulation protein AC|nr:stage III sporulation protein AC [Peptococcaceae bacterium]
MINVDIIFKIAGVGILIAVLHMVLKEAGKETMAEMATIAGVAVVLFWVVPLLARLFEQVKTVFRLF